MKRTVLITGANKSIGFEVARQLLKQDYFVFIGSRDIQRGKDAVQKLKEESFGDVDMLQIDVADKASHRCCKSNAGSEDSAPGCTHQQCWYSWCDAAKGIGDKYGKICGRFFDTNFFGAIQTAQAFIPLLKKSDAPRIIMLPAT